MSMSKFNDGPQTIGEVGAASCCTHTTLARHVVAGRRISFDRSAREDFYGVEAIENEEGVMTSTFGVNDRGRGHASLCVRAIFNQRIAIVGVGFVAAFVSGCGEQEGPLGDNPTAEGSPAVATVTSALTSSASNAQYDQLCAQYHVPVPPNYSSVTAGKPSAGIMGTQWKFSGHFDDGFRGLKSDVYYYQEKAGSNTAGMCVLAVHGGDPFDVICQGTNGGKACFWEGSTNLFGDPPTTPVIISSWNTTPQIPAGAGIPGIGCTACHAGENVFIGHYTTGVPHALKLVGQYGWMPPQYQDPIVPAGAGLPQAPPSTVNYPTTCATGGCHVQGGLAGRFPLLETPAFQGNYCEILARVTSIPAAAGGMPPNSTACDTENGPFCPNNADPAVRAMLAKCGQPNPITPLSLSGFGYPGIDPSFQAARRHDSETARGEHQHFFQNATETLPRSGAGTLKPTDKIQVSVYLPASDPPQEIMLQVNNGSGWFRVFWGLDHINWAPKHWMGLLPSTGSWQTLSFTPTDLGLPANSVLSGMAFTLDAGRASWADVVLKPDGFPYGTTFISQVWVGDRLPAGAQMLADGGDDWNFQPSTMTTPFAGQSYQSSRPNSGTPEKGVDRNTDGNFWNGSVFHTNNTYNSTGLGVGTGGEYWYTDLGKVKTVRRVVLYNRTDCCGGRLSHFRINYFDPILFTWRVASDQSNTILQDWSDPVIPINFPDVSTRYIMVQKTNNDYLHLAEVEVYGDP
jgi:hypothetical protein